MDDTFTRTGSVSFEALHAMPGTLYVTEFFWGSWKPFRQCVHPLSYPRNLEPEPLFSSFRSASVVTYPCYLGIIGKNMETAMMGSVGFRV